MDKIYLVSIKREKINTRLSTYTNSVSDSTVLNTTSLNLLIQERLINVHLHYTKRTTVPLYLCRSQRGWTRKGVLTYPSWCSPPNLFYINLTCFDNSRTSGRSETPWLREWLGLILSVSLNVCTSDVSRSYPMDFLTLKRMDTEWGFNLP